VKKLLLSSAVLALLAGASPAFAGSGSIAGPFGDASRDGTVSFTAEIHGDLPFARVSVTCRQAQDVVFYDSKEVSAESPDASFTLAWIEPGSADCEAQLVSQKSTHGGDLQTIVLVDSVSFSAAG
jgi:hypothetical protein